MIIVGLADVLQTDEVWKEVILLSKTIECGIQSCAEILNKKRFSSVTKSIEQFKKEVADNQKE